MSDKKITTEFTTSLKIFAVLIVITAMSIYYYGIRALIVVLITVLTSCVADILCTLIEGRKLHIHNVSPYIIGLTLALMLPAAVPYRVAVFGAIFAVCISGHATSGKAEGLLNSAACGWVFISLAFPEDVLYYTKPFVTLELSETISQTTTHSLSVASSVSDYEILIGAFAGSIGATAIILLIVCAIILICSKAVSLITLIATSLPIFIYNIAIGGIQGVKYAFCGGMCLFGLIFLICASANKIKTNYGKMIYGLIAGLCTILITYYGATENPIIYATIISSPFIYHADIWGKKLCNIILKKTSKEEAQASE